MKFKDNSLDLDTNDKEIVIRIMEKIINCEDLISLEFEHSLQKGIHLFLLCSKDCEKCRIVFDDTIRYSYDLYRKISSQNVMFDKKEFFKCENKKQI